MEQYSFMLEEALAHNCRFNIPLTIGFGWLMDAHKMTLLSKQNPKNLKEADGTGLSIMKCLLLHIYISTKMLCRCE